MKNFFIVKSFLVATPADKGDRPAVRRESGHVQVGDRPAIRRESGHVQVGDEVTDQLIEKSQSCHCRMVLLRFDSISV